MNVAKTMSIKRLTVGVALVLLAGTASGAAMVGALPHGQNPAETQKPAPAPGTAAKPSVAGPQRPPDRKPWWLDEAIKKELGLTADQAKTIDQIYVAAKNELTGYADARDRENKELERLIDESKVEQWVILRQIDKVETQRKNFNTLRTMTLYRMHRALTPEQRVKLGKIQDRDHRDPRKHP